MFCHNCGNKLPDIAKFCSKCGTKVAAEPPSDDEDETDTFKLDDKKGSRKASASDILPPTDDEWNRHLKRIAENDKLAKVSFESGKDNYSKKNYDAAVADLTRAIVLREKPNPDDYYWLGQAHYRIDNNDEAISNLTKAMELRAKPEPNDYLYRGYAYADKGSYDAAIADYTKAIELREKPTVNDYYYRGQAYLKKGDNNSARKDFEKVLEIDPKHSKAQEALNSLPKPSILSLFTKR